MHPRLHTLLAARVHALLQPREDAVQQRRAEVDALRSALAALDDRVRVARRQAEALEGELTLFRAPFHAEMTVHQAWLRHPRAREVFGRHHLPACDRCAVRFEETVAEAAAAYRLDLPGLLGELNTLLGEG